MKRGRKSSAELSIVSPIMQARPSAPETLSPEQRAIWEDVVTRLPADWFPRETHALLAEYCKASARAAFIGEELDRATAAWLLEEGGVERYARLAATADREVRRMAALARSLRITNQSRLRPETAARKAAGLGVDGPPPWEGALWLSNS